MIIQMVVQGYMKMSVRVFGKYRVRTVMQICSVTLLLHEAVWKVWLRAGLTIRPLGYEGP